MEDRLEQYKSGFHELLSERQFCDIHFAFPSSVSLDGVEIVSAHRNIMIAASPYLRNKIELMTELGMSAASKGSSREQPWLLPGIDKRGFEIVVDFIYHPRDLSVVGADEELACAMSPTIARAVFEAARLLLMPVVQAMMFKVLAAELTSADSLGALQLCLQSKEQWVQLEGQGESLLESALRIFAYNPVEATDVALKVTSGHGDANGNVDATGTLSYSLANCDLNFFETLFGSSFPIKDSAACNSFFSLLLAWHRLSIPGATAVSLLSWLSLLIMPSETFTWSANAQEFSALRSNTNMASSIFKLYGQEFYLRLVKDDRGSTNAGVYLIAQNAMPGWPFAYTLTIKETADLPAASITLSPYVFLKADRGYGIPSMCSTAKLLLPSQSESPSYVTTNGNIEILVTVTSTSLVRLGAAFLTDNFESLIKDEFFGTLSSSKMEAVLPFNELRVSSELVLLQALLKWNGSKDKVSEDMLHSIRLSQINFEALLAETQSHACLRKSELCKKHIETIVKNAFAGMPQSSSSMPAQQPRLHATAGSSGNVGCTEMISFMMEPSKKLAATELLLNDACNEAVSEKKEMQLKVDRLTQARAHDLLRRAGLRARCRLHARGQNAQRKRKAELELPREQTTRDLND
jgi:hypothetical protein